MFKNFTPRLRFSLRALLVIVTIGGIVLGVIVNRAERQRKAVAWIEEHRGSVRYAHVKVTRNRGLPQKTEVLPAPKWLIDLLGEHYFFRPTAIELEHLQGTEDLLPLGNLPTVERVSLEHSNVTAKQLRQLGQMPGFGTLCLNDVQLADDAVTELHSAKNLQILTALFCRISAENTQAIFELEQLKELYFFTCELDLSTVGNGSRLQNLEQLYFSDETKAIPGDLGQLAPLPKLREIMLPADWTAETYAALTRQPALAMVYVYDGDLSPAAIEHLTAIPGLRNMHMECYWPPETVQRLRSLSIHFNLTSRPPQHPRNQELWDFDKRTWNDASRTATNNP